MVIETDYPSSKPQSFILPEVSALTHKKKRHQRNDLMENKGAYAERANSKRDTTEHLRMVANMTTSGERLRLQISQRDQHRKKETYECDLDRSLCKAHQVKTRRPTMSTAVMPIEE
jgi:hypothetical protein